MGLTIVNFRESFGQNYMWVAKWPVPWCIGGDLNVVRVTSERLGGSRSVK